MNVAENNRLKRNISLLILGRTTSLFASGIYSIALPLYIFNITGSLAKMGVFFAITSIFGVIFSPIIGVYVEKINRKYALVLCDFITSLIYFIILILLIMDKFSLFNLAITTIPINIINNFFNISSSVIFTELNNENTIEKMNGLKSIADNGASVISPMIGTFLFGLCGFKSLLIVISLLFLISSIQELFIKYDRPKEVNLNKSIYKNLKEGFLVILNNKKVLPIFILIMALNFFIANSPEIINPGIIIKKYEISKKIYGATTTFFILGTILAGIIIYKNHKINFKKYLKKLLIINSIFMIIIGILSITMYGLPKNLYFIIFLLIQIILGFLTTIINVPIISEFQITIPIEFQGRFFSMLSFASGILVPLGISYTGVLADYIGADTTYIINNICVILIVIFLFKKSIVKR